MGPESYKKTRNIFTVIDHFAFHNIFILCSTGYFGKKISIFFCPNINSCCLVGCQPSLLKMSPTCILGKKTNHLLGERHWKFFPFFPHTQNKNLTGCYTEHYVTYVSHGWEFLTKLTQLSPISGVARPAMLHRRIDTVDCRLARPVRLLRWAGLADCNFRLKLPPQV